MTYIAEPTPPPAVDHEPIPTSTGYITTIIAATVASVGGILVSIVVVVCLWCAGVYWKKSIKRNKDKSGKKGKTLDDTMKMRGSLMPLHTITQVKITLVPKIKLL